MLTGHDIRLSLGRRPVLNGISFTARAGEVTAVAGPNGSGKTTLLRTLTGELRHQGQVMLNGRDIRHLAPVELAALRGVLPQKTNLAFPFTALEVVKIGQSFGIDQDPGLPRRALERVGMLAFAERPYQVLSGGEQARVQLARVLVQVWEPKRDGVPRWLFLDEPVASLDIGHQMQVMEIACDFADQGGGVLAVMHDLNLTAMFADQVLLMTGGQIRAAGTPREVFTSANLSAAYGCPVAVSTTPPPHLPFVLPHGVGPLAGAV